jgi:Xaa-Pro aminopeptidase
MTDAIPAIRLDHARTERESLLPERLCNLERLLATMEARDIDGLVSYYVPNVLYLSSFYAAGGHAHLEANGLAAFVFSRHHPDHPILVVQDTELAFFRHQPSWVSDIRPFSSLVRQLDMPDDPDFIDNFLPQEALNTDWARRMRENLTPSLVLGVRKAVGDLGLSHARVAFDNPRLARQLRLDDVEEVDGYGLMKHVRLVKTPQELEILKTAADINQRALQATVDSWTRGMTWRDLAREYARNVTARSGLCRDPYPFVVSNPPHGDPAFLVHAGLDPDYAIEPGMRIMFDCHGTFKEYGWDGGKTWIVDGGDDPASVRTANAFSEALQEMEARMVPGTKISELQGTARAVLRRHGLADPERALFFFHGVGLEHGEIELPAEGENQRLADWSVTEGMVISTHLYYGGSVRERYWLEDVAIVHDDGARSIYDWGFQPLTR